MVSKPLRVPGGPVAAEFCQRQVRRDSPGRVRAWPSGRVVRDHRPRAGRRGPGGHRCPAAAAATAPRARRHVLRAGPSPSSSDPPARRYGPSSGRDWAACPWPTHAPRRRLDIWTHRCPCWPTPTTTHSTSFRPSRTPGPASYRAPPANGARPCDADSHPADDLLPLYHRRRQAETRYFSLKSTILDGRVLRSSSVPGLE